MLLELTHRLENEKQVWVPAPSNKVYWPPAAPHPTRLDSGASNLTGQFPKTVLKLVICIFKVNCPVNL